MIHVLKTFKDLKEYLNNQSDFMLNQPIVVKNGDNPAEIINEATELNQKFYYDHNEPEIGCFTANQMKEMGIPEKYWVFDHEHSSILLKSEQF